MKTYTCKVKKYQYMEDPGVRAYTKAYSLNQAMRNFKIRYPEPVWWMTEVVKVLEVENDKV